MDKVKEIKGKSLEVNFNEKTIKWDEFVKLSPQRSIFVFTDFLNSIKYDYKLITTYEKNRIVLGTLIIFDEDERPIKRMLPFNLYQGILFAENKNYSFHKSISYNLKVLEFTLSKISSKYNEFSLCTSWRINDLRAFLWHNYHKEDQRKFKNEVLYTGIIQKKLYDSFDHYLKKVRSSRRQEFKKSLNNLTFKSSNNVELLFQLYKKTLDRQNISITNEEKKLLFSMSRQALNKGYGKMFLAFFNENPISAVFILNDDISAYYWIGASDPNYRKLNGSTFLLFNIIKEFFESDLKEFDFLGTNSPKRGDYKLSFNCELKQFAFLKI